MEQDYGLIDAISKDETNLAIRLINSPGINIEALNSSNKRALHVACSKGNLEVVEELIKHYVDLHTADGTNFTALHNAIVGRNETIVKIILKAGVDRKKVNSCG